MDALDPRGYLFDVITIGEIVKGIEKLPPSRRKAGLQAWLDDDLLVRFEGNVVSLTN